MTFIAKILTIDPHSEWLDFAEQTLRDAGYDVAVALDLEKALDLYANQGFDLVLIGLAEVERHLKKLPQLTSKPGYAKRFVVMFPVHQDFDKVRIFFKAGAYDCVDKPFEADRLLAMVSEELAYARRLNG